MTDNWTREIHRRFWVIEYVNGQSFVGRFDSHWTRTHDLNGAALWESTSLAENALQALLQEAESRIGNKEKHAAQMWWDLYGGLCVVSECEQITRLVTKSSDEAAVLPLLDTPPTSEPYQRIGELERENERLWRKINAEQPRKWIETDDPDVVACMGSQPACAENGCQLLKAQAEVLALREQQGW